jgi:hypothetical protein
MCKRSKTLHEDRERNENSLRVMYRQSGQWQVRVQPNSVGIAGEAERSIILSGGTGSS